MNFSGLKALVVGQGSIGQRHARILREQDADVDAVSASSPKAFRSLQEAFSQKSYDYIVVANETSRHMATVRSLGDLHFNGTVLIEKPLSVNPIETFLPAPFKRVGVAYNLRFHPIVQALKDLLERRRVIDIRVHVGQYLPDWRPETSYLVQSSAKRSAGGGVLRDLSHEIDLIGYLAGPWKRLVSIGGNRGALNIETDEAWGVLLELSSGAYVSLTLNYFDRPVERRIVVNTCSQTITADLVTGRIVSNGSGTDIPCERDYTYRAQHQAMLDAGNSTVCSFEEAVSVMKTIAAIERSADEQIWISK